MPPLIHLLALLIFVFGGQAQISRANETRNTETVAPGVEHVEIRRGDFSIEAAPEKDRWTIHALIVDPRHARLKHPPYGRRSPAAKERWNGY